MGAKIRYKGFDKNESLKLKRFLSACSHFSRIWGSTVYLDAPHGKIIEPVLSKNENSVYVHFFSVPFYSSGKMKKSPKNIVYANQVLPSFFGFTIPKGNLVSQCTDQIWRAVGEGVGALLPQANTGVCFREHSDKVFAQVVDRNIYILFDLSHEPFAGDEQVFWEIMELATPSIIGTEGATYLERSLKCLNADKVRIKRNAKRIGQEFQKLSVYMLNMELNNAILEADKFRERAAVLETEHGHLEARLILLKEVSNNLILGENEYERLLSDEFDLLHNFESILGVEIDIQKEEMCVCTRPITHTKPNGESRTLAQYKIYLHPTIFEGKNGNSRPGIKICEWGWKGRYKHPEEGISRVGPTPPCFGQTFITSIDKALNDYDFKVLITLIIHYLSSDDRVPTPRDSTEVSPEEYSEKSFYTGEYAKKKMKEAYVQFSKKHRGRNLKLRLKEELDSVTKEEKKVFEEWRCCRNIWLLNRHKAGFLRSYLETLKNNMPREFELVLSHPALMNLAVVDKFVWTVFGPGEGVGKFAGSWFFGTLRIVIHVPSGKVRACGTHGSSLTSCPGSHLVEINDYTVFAKMIAKGQLSETILGLYKMFRGGDIPECEKVNEITVKEVEQYLINETFPK